MRNRLCLLLALLMLFTVCVPAFAVDDDTADKIEVTVVYGNGGLLLNKCKPDQGFMLIHAIYTEGGALQSVQMQEIDLGGYYFKMVSLAEPYSSRSRIFLWENLESMKPVEFTLNVSDDPYQSATPAPTPTQSATPTATPTPAVGSTPTPTPTPTPIPTPTPTQVPTPSEPVLVTDPIEQLDVREMAKREESTLLQDFGYYAEDTAYLTKRDTTSDGKAKYTYKGDNSDSYYTLVWYLSLLSSDSMNFKQTSGNFSYITNGYTFDYHFEYTGTGDVTGDVTVYATYKYAALQSLDISVPRGLEYTDLGYRRDENIRTVTPVPAGESAMAGLYRNPDGSYETDDGRLKTEVGHAAVLVNGESADADTAYTIYTNKKEVLDVTGYSGQNQLYFRMPYQYTLSGDLYDLEDLKGDHKTYQNYNWSPNSYSPGASLFAQTVWLNSKNQWIFPQFDANYNHYDALTVRVMYYERGGDAVFYIYSGQDVTPNKIEALCAVNMDVDEIADSSGGSSGGSSSGASEKHTCVTCGGDGKCHKCNGTGRIVRYQAGGGTLISGCPYCHGSGKCYACGGSGER